MMKKVILSSRNILIAIMMITLGVLTLTGCSAVTERLVPGPTRVVYVKNKITNIPPKPKPINNVRFKKITFDKHVYYGVSKEDAINLTIGVLNTLEYNEKLLKVIETYNDTNTSK